MNVSSWRSGYETAALSMSRHEAIAYIIESAIRSGELVEGERLPTVRALSSDLGVSMSTVVAAYNLLRENGQIAGEVGRGTFILPARTPVSSSPQDSQETVPPIRPPWRRRTLLTSANRLHTLYPGAIDCSRGKPDTNLLLTEIVRRSLHRAADAIEPEDLQYAAPQPLPVLRNALLPRLVRDHIAVDGMEMVVGTSAQQLMVMSLLVAARLAPDQPRLVAVEEPGYQTVFDAFEQLGFRLVGVQVDGEGATPQSLDAALRAGALVALLTPCAQNPKGVSWTRQRRLALANVLADHPKAIAIEDDQFADLAMTRPGSLIEDRRVGERAIYIRTFAKSIAPDLRVAVALARPRLAAFLAESKGLFDGWTSLLSQRTLAYALEDPGLDDALADAQSRYESRRQTIHRILAERLAGSGAEVSGTDGVNLWIRLPPGKAASGVVDRAGALGVLIVSGEPFYIRPGRNDVIRMSVSGMADDAVATAAERVADAIRSTTEIVPTGIPL